MIMLRHILFECLKTNCCVRAIDVRLHHNNDDLRLDLYLTADLDLTF